MSLARERIVADTVSNLLKNPIVKCFLTNFNTEKNNWGRIIEIALCYGIHCLSNNYTLSGFQLDDLETINQDILKNCKTYSYRPIVKRSTTVLNSRRKLKASSNWRSGEKSSILPPSNTKIEKELNSLKPQNFKEEIQVYEFLMGKEFIEAAWTKFALIQSDNEQLNSKDIQNANDQLSLIFEESWNYETNILKTLSFSLFLRCFLQKQLKKSQSKNRNQQNSSRQYSEEKKIIENNDSVKENTESGKGVNYLKKKEVKADTGKRNIVIPKGKKLPIYLTTVKSQIKPELDRQRSRIDSVQKLKKQATDLMLQRPSLDSSRETRQEEGPLALRIANEFLQGSLMQEFANENLSSRLNNSLQTYKGDFALNSKDRISEDIYGLNDINEFYEPKRIEQKLKVHDNYTTEKEQMPPKLKNQNFSGWLGDFGDKSWNDDNCIPTLSKDFPNVQAHWECFVDIDSNTSKQGWDLDKIAGQNDNEYVNKSNSSSEDTSLSVEEDFSWVKTNFDRG